MGREIRRVPKGDVSNHIFRGIISMSKENWALLFCLHTAAILWSALFSFDKKQANAEWRLYGK
jgi:hypothetical protein